MSNVGGLLLRPYGHHDAVAIAEIYAHYVRTSTVSFELIPPSATELAARLRALQEQGYPALVADGAEGLLGFAYAQSFRARPAYQQTVEHSVYVDPARRQCGIGRALMTALMEQLRRQGYTQMVGVIADPEQHGSLAFHQRLGFRLAGRLQAVGSKFGRALDVVLVQRSL